MAIFTVNRGGHLTFFNTAAEQITGYSRRHVLGQPAANLLKGEAPSALTALEETMNDGRPRTRGNLLIVTRDGGDVPVRAEFLP